MDCSTAAATEFNVLLRPKLCKPGLYVSTMTVEDLVLFIVPLQLLHTIIIPYTKNPVESIRTPQGYKTRCIQHHRPSTRDSKKTNKRNKVGRFDDSLFEQANEVEISQPKAHV